MELCCNCVISGCINSKLAQHLYMLGPNCASSDLRTLQLCGFPLQASQLSSSTRVSLSTTRTIPIQNIIQMLEVITSCRCNCGIVFLIAVESITGI